MRVYKPTDNPLTQGYSSAHPAYDHGGNNLPDAVRAGMNGVIIERVDTYNKNWQANTSNDPFKPASGTRKLLTQDYGNYIKIQHDDGTFELHCHLRQGSSFFVGTKVTAGQTVARIGNTGNSTGPHVHSEYRTASNVNTPVDFYTGSSITPSDGNMYKGLDLANPEAMKVCVDIWHQVMIENLYVKKTDVEALQKEVEELRKRPANCPTIDDSRYVQFAKKVQIEVNNLG